MSGQRIAMKTPLAAGELERLVRTLGGGSARVAGELTDGMFNIAYRIQMPTGSGVLKIAPDPSVEVLTYEHDLVVAELDFLDRTRGLIPAPGVIARELDAPRPAFLMEMVPGRPLHGAELTEGQRDIVRYELGRALAALRGVRGEAFGYLRPDGSFRADTWAVAFAQMWAAIVEDARRWQVSLPEERGSALIRRAAPVLDEVDEPVLTHFDLWDGNVFADAGPHGARLSGVIDGERRFWGDPLAELASTSLLADAEQDRALLEGFASAHAAIAFTDAERARLALYRAYLSALMIVEAAPRGYAAEHVAWTDAHVRPALAAQLTEAESRLSALGR